MYTSSGDDDSDTSLDLMIAAAILIHEHTERQGLVHMGPVCNLKRIREVVNYMLYRDYFHSTKPIYPSTFSNTAYGCQESYF
jgi:hypothetical protein